MKSDWTLYHNPKCSKSRQTKELLESKNINFTTVEYLSDPLSKLELKEIISKLGCRPKDVIRTKEIEFKSLNIDLENDQQVLDAIVKLPKLLERPIVVHKKQAQIGRPPENILKLF